MPRDSTNSGDGPGDGEDVRATVVATITGTGVKDLVTVSVTDGSGQTGQVTATAGHPFWVPDIEEWVDAGELRPGMWVQTSSGTWVQVTAIEHDHREQTVHNLTIDTTHTYSVYAGADDAILTHNCGTGAASSEDAVQIFRNVDGNEFDAIAESGTFATKPGMMEGKWFATTGENAEQWGTMLNAGRGLTVETRVPRSVVNQLHFTGGNLDGVGPGWYADSSLLSLINQHMMEFECGHDREHRITSRECGREVAFPRSGGGGNPVLPRRPCMRQIAVFRMHCRKTRQNQVPGAFTAYSFRKFTTCRTDSGFVILISSRKRWWRSTCFPDHRCS